MKNILHGNAVVGQSGGPTAAINATLAGVIAGAKTAHENGVIHTLYGMKNGIDGFLREDTVNLFSAVPDKETLSLLENTPAAALGSCRKKLPPVDSGDEIYEKLVALFKKYDIRYFFYIGGNDSMDTVSKISAYTAKIGYDMRVIGVPKTIDNDLCATDHTPGFGSAAKFIAAVTSEMIRDCSVYAVPAVTIIEFMGRDAGWLTASAALAGENGGNAPDFVYLPERVFDMDAFITSVKEKLQKQSCVVVAVSEGVRYQDGTYVGAANQNGARDVFGHSYLAGTGKALEYAVKDRIGCKVRSVELNLPQRCAGHLTSLTDIKESVRVGMAAVKAAVNGATGKMMCFVRKNGEKYGVTCVARNIKDIANYVRTVPDEFITAEGNGITEEGLAYLRPLIRGETHPVFQNGIPKHFILK